MPVVRKKPTKKIAPVIAARLNGRFSLHMQADGSIAAALGGGYSVSLGQFSVAAIDRAARLTTGLPLTSFAGKSVVAKQVHILVERLARHGLLEYRFFSPRDEQDLVVIEPQVSEYWPQCAKLGSTDTIVLSRFAYLHRLGNEMVLESPRAGALFRICDPSIAVTLAVLSRPQRVSKLRSHAAFSNLDLLGLLLDSQILIKLNTKAVAVLRIELDQNLAIEQQS